MQKIQIILFKKQIDILQKENQRELNGKIKKIKHKIKKQKLRRFLYYLFF